jgi:hypothetical protein
MELDLWQAASPLKNRILAEYGKDIFRDRDTEAVVSAIKRDFLR